MKLVRNTRPGDATASSGSMGYVMPANLTTGGLEAIDERLHQIKDEEAWRNSHTKLVLKYNFSSLSFWLLLIASLCFASLNAHHGYLGGLASGTIAAVVIAFIYFTIELTIPVSAHWVSWAGDGGHKWTVRLIGIIAYGLGVIFSLLILQGNFAKSADSTQANTEVASLAFASDTHGLKQAMEQREQLVSKVKRSVSAVKTELDTVLAAPFGKETLSSKTEDCTARRRPGRERDLCEKVDALKVEGGNAEALATLDEQIEKLKTGLMDRSKTGDNVQSSDASNKALSKLTGYSTKSIEAYKPSLLAMIAAFITHILWGAHGMTVNSGIRGRQREHMEVSALTRAVEREHRKVKLTAEETNAEFARRQGMQENVASTMMRSPLSEQPAAMQVQAFFTERTIMGDLYSQSVGIIHDDYAQWAKSGRLPILNISRFAEIVRGIGMAISADGRVLGAAIRSGG
jgi:hypothetical protein